MEKWWVRCGFLGVNINTNINSLRRKKGVISPNTNTENSKKVHRNSEKGVDLDKWRP